MIQALSSAPIAVPETSSSLLHPLSRTARKHYFGALQPGPGPFDEMIADGHILLG
jgi:hypothetical protein